MPFCIISRDEEKEETDMLHVVWEAHVERVSFSVSFRGLPIF